MRTFLSPCMPSISLHHQSITHANKRLIAVAFTPKQSGSCHNNNINIHRWNLCLTPKELKKRGHNTPPTRRIHKGYPKSKKSYCLHNKYCIIIINHHVIRHLRRINEITRRTSEACRINNNFHNW